MMNDKLFCIEEKTSRSVSPENPTGEKGNGARKLPEEGSTPIASGDLGIGWKTNPFIRIGPGETEVLAAVDGMGIINSIWCTPTGIWRYEILRIYWDDSEVPSVECPIGDFFACGWGKFSQVSSLAVCVNPGKAFNCYWQMPFRKNFRVTLENRSSESIALYYQINYSLCEIPSNSAYFHAFFNRSNPLPYKSVHSILGGVNGKGKYVGTYIAWGSNSTGWWGEGEIKFYIDGDKEFPTICGTGTEDYFGGAYNFENPDTHDSYLKFTTPYSGLCQVIEPDRLYSSQFRFGMYRWHITDSVSFNSDLRVTIQALGWRKTVKKFLPLQDDISSVAYFYLDSPSQTIPALADNEQLEIN